MQAELEEASYSTSAIADKTEKAEPDRAASTNPRKANGFEAGTPDADNTTSTADTPEVTES